MSVVSNVSYSGLNHQQRLKDIQRAERIVTSYYDSLGGETKRTSHWNIDDKGNVSHYAHVRREDKLNEKLRKETNEKAKELRERICKNSGVSYEKTIPDSITLGFKYMKSIEQQLNGTKFFVGTVSYGQTYGNSTDTNFVINPYFLERLGTDEATRKQFEEDVKYLKEFSERFRAQQLSNGREIVSQGWFCDENGNWGGWSVSKPINTGSVLQDMTDYIEEIRQKKLEERKEIEQELKEYFGDRFIGFHVKWLEEDIKNEEVIVSEETKSDSEKETTTVSTSVGVNAGKMARKIAAAKTKEQLRMVIAEIKNDMQVVKDAMEKGWCDEAEMDKVNMLMSMAQNRMGQVEDREATPEEENLFAMASLM